MTIPNEEFSSIYGGYIEFERQNKAYAHLNYSLAAENLRVKVARVVSTKNDRILA